MSHGSDDSENYWPGYVDALTSMVQVLAFVMMMLAMAVFVLSQSVAKHAVERPGPGIAIRLLAQTVRLQQITQLPVGADNAECDLTRRQLTVKIV